MWQIWTTGRTHSKRVLGTWEICYSLLSCEIFYKPLSADTVSVCTMQNVAVLELFYLFKDLKQLKYLISYEGMNNHCSYTYYMPARGYEFYLRVFNLMRERVRYRVEHEKIKFISTSGHVIFCLLYKHQFKKRRDLLCNHNDGDLFTCEDNMLFLRVKIWSFRAKAHLVVHWCSYKKMYNVLKVD